jgi:hypothetical protein
MSQLLVMNNAFQTQSSYALIFRFFYTGACIGCNILTGCLHYSILSE